jgi:hypothetical protein
MYNVVLKTIGYWRFYWGSRNGFQNAGGEISVHIYGLTVLAKALKPLPVVKRMRMKNVWCICWSGTKIPSSLCRFNGKWPRKETLSREQNVQCHAFFL